MGIATVRLPMTRLAGTLVLGTLVTVVGCSATTVPLSQTSPGADAAAPMCNAPSTQTTLVGATPVSVEGLFLMGSRAFFSSTEGLSSVPLSGGPSTLIVSGGSGVAIVGGTLYYVASHAVGAVDPQGKQPSAPALYAMPLSGGAADGGVPDGGASTLVQDNFSEETAVVDGTSLYVAGAGLGVLKITPPSTSPITLTFDGAFSIRALAVDATYLYAAVGDLAAVPNDGVIVRMPKSGGATERLITLGGFPDGLVVDDQALYWIDEPTVGTFGSSRVVRADLEGRNDTALIDASNSSASPSEIALGPTHLYFLAGSLGRVPKLGGAIETIVPDLSAPEAGPGALQVSGADVAWVDNYVRALSSTASTSVEAICVGGTR